MLTDSYSYNAYSQMQDSLFGVKVKSAGHIYAKTGRRISRPNGRNDWLFFYVARGCERFQLGEQTADATAGSFIFFKPSEAQEHFYTSEETGEFYYVHFTAPDDFDLLGFESSRIYRSESSSSVREQFEEIINELQFQEYGYEKICISVFFNILCRLERKREKSFPDRKKYINDISIALNKMNREYAKSYTLSEYAELCNMSKFHFLRVFKEITGKTPLEYRGKVRLEHAAELLSDSNMSVGEIAASTGFSSQGYFCDAFKKNFGVSPIAFRKNNCQ